MTDNLQNPQSVDEAWEQSQPPQSIEEAWEQSQPPKTTYQTLGAFGDYYYGAAKNEAGKLLSAFNVGFEDSWGASRTQIPQQVKDSLPRNQQSKLDEANNNSWYNWSDSIRNLASDYGRYAQATTSGVGSVLDQITSDVGTLPDKSDLLKLGYSQEDIDNAYYLAKKSGGAIAAGTHSLERSILPAASSIKASEIGSELGVGLGAAIPGAGETGIPEAIGGFGGAVIGGLVGYQGMDEAQQYLLSKLPKGLQTWLGQSQEQQKQQETNHPIASFTGSLLPFAAGFRPGLKSLPTVQNASLFLKALATPLGQRALSAVAFGDFEAIQELWQNGKTDPEKVSIATAVGALLPRNQAIEIINSLDKSGKPPGDDGGGRLEPTINPPIPEHIVKAKAEGIIGVADTDEQKAAKNEAIASLPESQTANPKIPPDLHKTAREIAPDTFNEFDKLQEQQDQLRKKIFNPDSFVEERPEVEAQWEKIDTYLTRLERNGKLGAKEQAKLQKAYQDLKDLEEKALPESTDQLKDQYHSNFQRMSDMMPDVRAAYKAAQDRLGIHSDLPATLSEYRPYASETDEEPVKPVELAASPLLRSEASRPKNNFIAKDVAKKAIAAGEKPEVARQLGALVQAIHETRAAKFKGALGSAEDIYNRRSPEIVKGKWKGKTRKGKSLKQTAYHASHADFDEFSDEHIGTGEGAQMYGMGHYVGDARGLGEHYHAEAKKRSPTGKAYLYTVEVPKHEEFLNRDKPLSDQSPQVQEKLIKAGLWDGKEDLTGAQLYTKLAKDNFQVAGYQNSRVIASRKLMEAGLPGMSYSDMLSRLSAAQAEAEIPDLKEHIKVAELAVKVAEERKLDSLDFRKTTLRELQHKLDTYEKVATGNTSSNYVVFDPKSLKITNKEYFQNSDKPIFYSALAKGVDDLNQAKASPDQWINTIHNLKGVKKEELDQTGVEAWLKTQKGSVSKEDVQEFLKDNQLNIHEVERGEGLNKATRYNNPSWRLPGGENYRELQLTLPNNADQFQSAHWDEPNVLSHVRFDTRFGPDGEKVLHIHEVQSDWHQKGHAEGYNEGLTEAEKKELEELNKKSSKIPNAPFKNTWEALTMKRMLRYAADHDYDKITWDTGETVADRFNLSHQIDNLKVHKLVAGEDKGKFILVANKGDETVYTTAALDPKQLVDHIGKELAVKIAKDFQDNPDSIKQEYKGLDLKVGGEFHKLTYDVKIPSFLKQYTKKWGGKVEESALNTPPPEKTIEMFNKANPVALKQYNSVVQSAEEQSNSVTNTAREQYESALKFAYEQRDSVFKSAEEQYNSVVKSAEDQPNSIIKSTREQYDSVVKPARDQYNSALKSAYEQYDSVVKSAYEQYKSALKSAGEQYNSVVKPARDQYDSAYENWNPEPKQTAVHSLPLTDEMKDAVQQGQPLFQAKSKEPPNASLTLREARNLLQRFNTANPTSMLHEFTHQWLEDLVEDCLHPLCPPELKQDLEIVRNSYNRARRANYKVWKKGKRPPKMAHEGFARGLEQYMHLGIAPSKELASVFAKFKAWFRKIYETLLDIPLAKQFPLTPELRGVYDRMFALNPHEDIIAPEPIEHEPIIDKTETTSLNSEKTSTKVAQSQTEGEQGAHTTEEPNNAVEPSERQTEGITPNREPSEEEFLQKPTDIIDKDGKFRIDQITNYKDLERGIKSSISRKLNESEARKDKLTDSDIVSLGKDVGIDPSQIDLTRLNGMFGGPEVSLAAKVSALAQYMRDAMDGITKGLADGDKAAVLSYKKNLLAAADIFIRKARPEFGYGGRALQLAYKQAEAAGDLTTFLQEHEGQTFEQVQQNFEALQALASKQGVTVEQLMKQMRQTSRKNKKSHWVTEVLINNMLWGPLTHILYAETIKVYTMYKSYGLTAVQAAISKLTFVPEGERVTFGELRAITENLGYAQMEGLAAAANAFKTGRSSGISLERLAKEKVDYELANGMVTQKGYNNRLEQLIKNPTGEMLLASAPPKNVLQTNAIGGWLGHGVRLPTERAITPIHSEAFAFRFVLRQSQLIYREAINKGLTGEALAQEIARLKYDTPIDIIKDARHEALKATLLSNESDLAKAITGVSSFRLYNGIQPFKILGEPFLGIPFEIFHQAVFDNTPLGLASKKIRDDILGGTDKDGNKLPVNRIARTEALGQLTLGTALVSSVYYLMKAGLYNGPANTDKKQAAVDLKTKGYPYSLHLGNESIATERMGVLGEAFAIASDILTAFPVAFKGIKEEYKGVTDDNEKEQVLERTDASKQFIHAAWLLIHHIGGLLTNFGALSGFSDMFESIRNENKMSQTVQKLSGLFEPGYALLSQTAHEMDPYQREAHGFIQQLMSQTPVLSEELKPRLDIWGVPVPNQKFVGAYTRETQNDPVDQYFTRHPKFFPSPVRQDMNGYHLTDDEYWDYQHYSGLYAKQALNNLIDSDFEQKPEFVQHSLIQSLVTAARSRAAIQLQMKYPKIPKVQIKTLKEMTEPSNNQDPTDQEEEEGQPE